MLKHVGKHSNRSVVILFRKVPGEDHMALVIYPETIPAHIHDDIMQALESDSGQQAKEFSDYLFRYTLKDGTNALQTLHAEGMIKKIPTNQVVITPNAKSSVRLDELNTILDKMAMGEEAINEMATLDANRGMRTGAKPEGREVGVPNSSRTQPTQVDSSISINDVLSDEQLATQRRAQAVKMQSDAEALLVESKRLLKEAQQLEKTTNGTRKKTKA